MSYSRFGRGVWLLVVFWTLLPGSRPWAHAAEGVNLRVMAANLPGNSQKIEPYAIRIFQGLKPDVVAIQEFRYGNSTPAEFRSFIDNTFGPEFDYYREPGSYNIPNGIISRYPILQAGSWDDPLAPDRGFAWAQVDLPGTNDLFIVSVHLLTSSSSDRAAEANDLKSKILASFPAGAWIIIGGDFNTGSRTESAITTFKSFLGDYPVPTDAESGGNPNTNNNREKPYDYLLVSWSMTNRMTNTVVGSRTFPNGLVFDSRVYEPLSDVYPVQSADSGNGQHMAVIKDFHLPGTSGGSGGGTAPSITEQPQNQTNVLGGNVTFTVNASGTAPLAYLWRFNESVLSIGSDNSFSVLNIGQEAAGNYSVVVTNVYGAATSAPAALVIVSQPPGESELLAGWDVSSQSGFGSSPMPANALSPLVNVVGLTRGPGVTTSGTAATRAWGGNGLDSSSAAAAVTAGDYITWSLSPAAGFRMSVESINPFYYRRSGTGPAHGVLEYQIGTGPYSQVANLSFTETTSSGALLPVIDLSGINSLQNLIGEVRFRLALFGATGPGGTWYVFDSSNSSEPDLAIVGKVQPIAAPPAVSPTILNPQRTSATFQFHVTGTTGSNYVVEATSDLDGPWQRIVTNTAPFTFSESISAEAGQKYFRCRVAP